MRKFQAEIDRVSADAACALCGIDFFLVAVELRSLCAIVVGAEIRFRHGYIFSVRQAEFLHRDVSGLFHTQVERNAYCPADTVLS